MNATTRAYLAGMGKLPDYAWLAPLVAKLEDTGTASAAADQIRKRDPEIHAVGFYAINVLTASGHHGISE